MTSPEELADNSHMRANTAKIQKAVRAWKDLLFAADRKNVDGVFWIMIPKNGGTFGPYRTAVMPPMADDS